MKNAPKIPRHHDYEVGYGKPPATTRFQKGKSGNPNGRPKGTRNKQPKLVNQVRELLLKEASREIKINEKSGPVSMPILQATIRSLSLKAAQGNVSSQKLFLDLTNKAHEHKANEEIELFRHALDYKERAYAEISAAKKRGQDIEHTFLPHPDHVITNVRTGEVEFIGPMDTQDKAVWDELWGKKREFEVGLEKLKDDLNNDHRDHSLIKNDIAHTDYLLSILDQTLIIRWNLPPENVIKDVWRRIQTEERIAKDELPPKPILLKEPYEE